MEVMVQRKIYLIQELGVYTWLMIREINILTVHTRVVLHIAIGRSYVIQNFLRLEFIQVLNSMFRWKISWSEKSLTKTLTPLLNYPNKNPNTIRLFVIKFWCVWVKKLTIFLCHNSHLGRFDYPWLNSVYMKIRRGWDSNPRTVSR